MLVLRDFTLYLCWLKALDSATVFLIIPFSNKYVICHLQYKPYPHARRSASCYRQTLSYMACSTLGKLLETFHLHLFALFLLKNCFNSWYKQQQCPGQGWTYPGPSKGCITVVLKRAMYSFPIGGCSMMRYWLTRGPYTVLTWWPSAVCVHHGVMNVTRISANPVTAGSLKTHRKIYTPFTLTKYPKLLPGSLTRQSTQGIDQGLTRLSW